MHPDPLDGCPVIVGSGLAGLLTALTLAPQPCILLTRAALDGQAGLGACSSSAWAQGGLAAAIGADDAPALHEADTLAAGDGLCDPAVVAAITAAGPHVIDTLARHGVRFDRAAGGAYALGLEAAHSRRRIVHAQGDATGAEIVRALSVAVLATPSVTVLDGAVLRRILLSDGQVCGLVADRHGSALTIRTGQLVLATGGLGGLFRDTTNPLSSAGGGLAAAARAGARLGDLEFVQFHPTALAAGGPSIGDASLKLVSEAVRGEGAVLVDETGARFMENELAPRDVVSRAVWRHLSEGHQVFLDARACLGPRFETRFPGITAACRARGIDPVTMPIPVRPAAHYHMGGILVDRDGRSTVPGLYACGEAACTGLHGANRLASNSLLEAAVTAERVAHALAGTPMRAGTAAPDGQEDAARPSGASLSQVREVMSRHVGVLRDQAGLEEAVRVLAPLATADDPALIGLMVTLSALGRAESRGGHFRTDHPERAPIGLRTGLTAAEAFQSAAPFTLPRRLAS